MQIRKGTHFENEYSKLKYYLWTTLVHKYRRRENSLSPPPPLPPLTGSDKFKSCGEQVREGEMDGACM